MRPARRVRHALRVGFVGDPMAVSVVVRRLNVLREAALEGDFARAHELEDCLHQEVLEAIARNPANAAALARTALRSRAIDFPRRSV